MTPNLFRKLYIQIKRQQYDRWMEGRTNRKRDGADEQNETDGQINVGKRSEE